VKEKLGREIAEKQKYKNFVNDNNKTEE